eukprot:184277-Amphidinium_carterae.1
MLTCRDLHGRVGHVSFFCPTVWAGSTSDAVSGLFMQLESFKEEQERRLKFMELSVFGQLQDWPDACLRAFSNIVPR